MIGDPCRFCPPLSERKTISYNNPHDDVRHFMRKVLAQWCRH